MKLRIAVIGTGLEGLLVSWVLRQHPFLEVTTIGDTPLGGDLVPGNTPTIVHTQAMGTILRHLNVPHSSYPPREGVHLRGEIVEYPSVLREMPEAQASKIIQACQWKQGMPRTPPHKVLAKPRRAVRHIRWAPGDLVEALVDGARGSTHIARWRLTASAEQTTGVRYDYAIVTVPLWELPGRAWFAPSAIPESPRTVATVVPREWRRLRQWERVLTPFTPANTAHSFSTWGDACAVEATGHVHVTDMVSDLNYLFPDGYALLTMRQDQRGVLPAKEFMRWPEHVAPVGMFAEGERCTLDTVIDKAYALMRRWTQWKGSNA